jgi:hypothetical protein
MKKTLMIFTLAALVMPAGCRAQNNHDMLKVPLNGNMPAGRDYPAVVFERLTLKPIYSLAYYQTHALDGFGKVLDSVMMVQVYLDATLGGVSHKVCMSHYMENREWNENLHPVVMGEYIVDMEVGGTEAAPEPVLTVGKLGFGKEFFLDREQEAVIGGVTMAVDRAGHKHFSSEYIAMTLRVDDAGHEHVSYDPDEPFEAIGVCSITLSEGDKRESFRFNTHDMDIEGWPPVEWEGYRIWILDIHDGQLKLKIEKPEI